MSSSIEQEIASLNRMHERLQSTSAEKFPSIVVGLLPRLILLTDSPPLRDKTVQVLSFIMKRVKEWRTQVPLLPLLKLVTFSQTPFVSNSAVSFIDAGLEFSLPSTSPEDTLECARAIVDSVCTYEVFSPQSNALCYYTIKFLDAVSDSLLSFQPLLSEPHAFSRLVIEDFLLDLALVSGSLVNGGVGSIQAGLSNERVQRITCKQATWSMVDLKTLKLRLIRSLNKQWMAPSLAIVISVACSVDLDQEVATEATFRMNGAKSLFKFTDNAESVINLLLDLSLPLLNRASTPSLITPENVRIPIREFSVLASRSALRENIRIAMLHFIQQNLPTVTATSATAVNNLHSMIAQRLLCHDLLQQSSATAVSSEESERSERLLSTALVLLRECIEKLTSGGGVQQIAELESVCSAALRSTSQLLKSFISSSNSVMGSVAGRGESATRSTIKTCCLNIIQLICQCNDAEVLSSARVSMANVLVHLLRWLFTEDFVDEGVRTALFAALEAIRLNLLTDKVQMEVDRGVGDLLVKGSGARDPKIRLISLRMLRFLFGRNEELIRVAISLVNDPTEEVANAAIKELDELLTNIQQLGEQTERMTNLFTI